MARYTGRQLPGSTGASASSGGFFNLGKQLAARRGLNRPIPKKIAPVKPSLTTSKQKEAEVSKLINKDYLPSGMQLAKLRQLAAQGNILNPKEARDFLHRSEAGKKLDTREGLQKFEAELLKAELQATREDVNSPIKYKFREGGESHLNQKAKELVRGLYKESAEQAHEQAVEASKANTLQDRQARLATLHAAIRPQAPAANPTPTMRSGPMPTLQAVEPLPSSAPTATNRNSSFTATPIGSGSHIPDAHPMTDQSSAGLGIPVAVRHEAATTMPVPSAEPNLQSEPIGADQSANLNPKPFDAPLPPHPSVPTETTPISDAFGGSGDNP